VFKVVVIFNVVYGFSEVIHCKNI